MKRLMNFGAGPGALPLPALERACIDLIDLDETGVGVLEHSHRGPAFDKVLVETDALLRKLANIGDTHEILFLHGGASTQFAQIPLAFLKQGQRASYVLTGVWGEKALSEAKIIGKMKGAEAVLLESTKESVGEGPAKKDTFLRVPTTFPTADGSAYLHFTSNETVHGVQFLELPKAGSAPLICDMSSDFLSRVVDFSQLDFVYAGAQKNAGPSGLAIIVAKKSFLEKQDLVVPKIWDYRIAAEQRSLYNTPSTFSIYMTRNVLRFIEEKGGIAAVEKENEKKAQLIYDVLDARPEIYRTRVAKNARSRMNVVFELENEAKEKVFLEKAKAADLFGLRGHRMVGGIRASIYNAVELAWVERLADFLKKYEA